MSILYEFTNSLKTEKAQFRWTDQSVQVLKAGTPLDANGAIANDATAVGIVAYDVPPSGRSMWSVVTNDGSYYADVELITSGFIDVAAAESSCGLEYTDAIKGKLADIVFVDGEIGSGGGGGGGGADVVLKLNMEEGAVVAVDVIKSPAYEVLGAQLLADISSVRVCAYTYYDGELCTYPTSLAFRFSADPEPSYYIAVTVWNMYVRSTPSSVSSTVLFCEPDGWVLD